MAERLLDPKVEIHLRELAKDMFSDEKAADKWLRQPLPGLGGVSPLEYALQEGGVIEVELLIGRLRHGVID